VTKQDDDTRVRRAEELSQDVEGALNLMLEKTIRESAGPNALLWLGTVGGAFVLNLLLIVLIAGR
jgi:hypothetical protein